MSDILGERSRLTVARPATLVDHRWFVPVAQIQTRSALPWAGLAVPLSSKTKFKEPEPLRRLWQFLVES